MPTSGFVRVRHRHTPARSRSPYHQEPAVDHAAPKRWPPGNGRQRIAAIRSKRRGSPRAWPRPDQPAEQVAARDPVAAVAHRVVAVRPELRPSCGTRVNDSAKLPLQACSMRTSGELREHAREVRPELRLDVGGLAAAVHRAAAEQQPTVRGEPVVVQDPARVLDAQVGRQQPRGDVRAQRLGGHDLGRYRHHARLELRHRVAQVRVAAQHQRAGAHRVPGRCARRGVRRRSSMRGHARCPRGRARRAARARRPRRARGSAGAGARRRRRSSRRSTAPTPRGRAARPGPAARARPCRGAATGPAWPPGRASGGRRARRRGSRPSGRSRCRARRRDSG